MQHQLEWSEDNPKRAPQERQSWGELLAAWLLVLWGVGTFVAVYWSVPGLGGKDRSLLYQILDITSLLQAVFCFLGGLGSLLPYRSVARWGLYLAAFTMAVFSTVFLYDILHRGSRDIMGIAIGASLLVFSGFLVFLGHWLGRQEEVVR